MMYPFHNFDKLPYVVLLQTSGWTDITSKALAIVICNHHAEYDWLSSLLWLFTFYLFIFSLSGDRYLTLNHP